MLVIPPLVARVLFGADLAGVSIPVAPSAEYADTQVGRKYVVDTSKGVGNAINTGVSDYARAYSTWAYAQQTFDGWAQQFRARLDQAHG